MDDLKKAKQHAFKLLTSRALLSTELEKKLSKSMMISKETIDSTIEFFKKLGYIDDDHLIKSFIKSMIFKKRGPNAIIQKLREKGVENAKEIVEEHYDEDKQIENIKDLMIKYKDKGREKTISSLQRKGFNVNMVLNVINEDL